jgi:protein-tyrosine-phosphatase/DNA-binding transcriptional ArsR family regulator
MASALSPQLQPPAVLRLAGHPVRWGLLRELAHSDLRVGELCSRLELPQNLVSYHLGRLRAAGAVASRRSAFDGRDAYYMLDVGRLGELLGGAGAVLHPGLRLAPPDAVVPARRRGRRVRLLFLCTGNSARSQIAEALVQHYAARAVESLSAGSQPKPLHANAVRVMAERGIDVRGRRSKHLDEVEGKRFDYVVSLCDRVREVCPEFPGHPYVTHWSIPDPAREGKSNKQNYPAFERTARELERRIPCLLALIAHQQEVKEVTSR